MVNKPRSDFGHAIFFGKQVLTNKQLRCMLSLHPIKKPRKKKYRFFVTRMRFLLKQLVEQFLAITVVGD